MWFGDLVTMRWWDDLWLKESFATWAANFALSEHRRRPGAGLGRVHQRLQDLGLPAGPAALHPPDRRRHGRPGGRRAELRRHHLRQGRLRARPAGRLRRPEEFLAGVRDYFATHAYGNTALGDLLAACSGRPGRDLSGWSAQWLETAGVNTLRLELRRDQAGIITEAAPDRRRPPDAPDPARAPDRARALRRARTAGWSAVGRVETTSPGRGRRCPAWSVRSAAGGCRGQRRRPHLRQGPAGPALALHGARRPAHVTSPLDPRGAAGRRPGTSAATASCRPPTTSSWCCAGWPSRPTPPPCAPARPGRPAPRTATPRRRAGQSPGRAWPEGWRRCWPRPPAGSDLQLASPGPSRPRPRRSWSRERLHPAGGRGRTSRTGR